jgi:hypothetical protein
MTWPNQSIDTYLPIDHRGWIRWFRNERGHVILMWPYLGHDGLSGEDGVLHWYWWD